MTKRTDAIRELIDISWFMEIGKINPVFARDTLDFAGFNS